MSAETVPVEEFINLAEDNLVLDVRSPSEFEHAHFPGALSLPLFDDEERKVVGTLYKQKSREEAIKIGLDYFGVKMKSMVSSVESELEKRNSKIILLYCWRGGMRSEAVAWLLNLYGFQVYRLEGGYKQFRNWVLTQFEKPYHLRVLSGRTGSGKTEILKELASLDEAVIDLEGLANHKGSAFGALGLPPQPSTESFENNLAFDLYRLTRANDKRLIWIESESNGIGKILINHLFFDQMKQAERIHVDIPVEARLDKIVREYGIFEKEELVAATERIQKRLGGLETKNVLNFLNEGDIREAFRILIGYYDKLYSGGTAFLPPSLVVQLETTDSAINAKIIIEKTEELV